MAKLDEALEFYYRQGRRIFLSGGALGFDTIAAQAVLRLRSAHPDTRLIIAVPCAGQSLRWTEEDREIYDNLCGRADQVIRISEEYFPGCMQKRNRFLVDHAEVCLCYLKQCRGGTWNTVSYAYDRGRTIRNLAGEIR